MPTAIRALTALAAAVAVGACATPPPAAQPPPPAAQPATTEARVARMHACFADARTVQSTMRLHWAQRNDPAEFQRDLQARSVDPARAADEWKRIEPLLSQGYSTLEQYAAGRMVACAKDYGLEQHARPQSVLACFNFLRPHDTLLLRKTAGMTREAALKPLLDANPDPKVQDALRGVAREIYARDDMQARDYLWLSFATCMSRQG
jgi:hypothetical protein